MALASSDALWMRDVEVVARIAAIMNETPPAEGASLAAVRGALRRLETRGLVGRLRGVGLKASMWVLTAAGRDAWMEEDTDGV